MKISELKEISSTVSRLIKYLKSLPDDEVFRNSEIEEKLNINLDSTNLRKNNTQLKPYTTRVSIDGYKCRVWGNENAINQLKTKLNEN